MAVASDAAASSSDAQKERKGPETPSQRRSRTYAGAEALLGRMSSKPPPEFTSSRRPEARPETVQARHRLGLPQSPAVPRARGSGRGGGDGGGPKKRSGGRMASGGLSGQQQQPKQQQKQEQQQSSARSQSSGRNNMRRGSRDSGGDGGGDIGGGRDGGGGGDGEGGTVDRKRDSIDRDIADLLSSFKGGVPAATVKLELDLGSLDSGGGDGDDRRRRSSSSSSNGGGGGGGGGMNTPGRTKQQQDTPWMPLSSPNNTAPDKAVVKDPSSAPFYRRQRTASPLSMFSPPPGVGKSSGKSGKRRA